MLVWWNSKEGKDRLFTSEYSNAFFTLAHLFEHQIKPTYCGIASAVMVLNALRLPKSLKLETNLDVTLEGGKVIPFNRYTQITFFNEDTLQVKCCDKVEGRDGESNGLGFTMDELNKAMRLLLLDVKISRAKDCAQKSVERFRWDLMAHMNESETFMIANFDSRSISRKGGGHFSPVGAYHKESDSCLVMDVAGHKNPWFWVPVPEMYGAMNTIDRGQYRGYMTVTDTL